MSWWVRRFRCEMQWMQWCNGAVVGFGRRNSAYFETVGRRKRKEKEKKKAWSPKQPFNQKSLAPLRLPSARQGHVGAWAGAHVLDRPIMEREIPVLEGAIWKCGPIDLLTCVVKWKSLCTYKKCARALHCTRVATNSPASARHALAARASPNHNCPCK